MRKPLGFYNYELLSGIDKKLFESLAEDEACLRKGTPVFKIRVPFDWAQNPHNDSNWCFQLHCWRMGDNAAAALAKGDYIAKMDDDDFYFEHYLSDMLIPFSFGDYAMVGKREVFMYLSGSNKLIRRFPGQRHMDFNFVAGPTFVIKKSVFDEIGFESRNTGEDSSFLKKVIEKKYKIYAADPFNFIQFRASGGGHTWGESDDYFTSNPQVKVEANGFASKLLSF